MEGGRSWEGEEEGGETGPTSRARAIGAENQDEEDVPINTNATWQVMVTPARRLFPGANSCSCSILSIEYCFLLSCFLPYAPSSVQHSPYTPSCCSYA